jgi:hypothetical protein
MRIRKEVQEASKGNFRIECPYKKEFWYEILKCNFSYQWVLDMF